MSVIIIKSPIYIILPKKQKNNTNIKTLGRCPNPHHLLKKVDENFINGKLRFPLEENIYNPHEVGAS
jgi:hypothetical protein